MSTFPASCFSKMESGGNLYRLNSARGSMGGKFCTSAAVSAWLVSSSSVSLTDNSISGPSPSLGVVASFADSDISAIVEGAAIVSEEISSSVVVAISVPRSITVLKPSSPVATPSTPLLSKGGKSMLTPLSSLSTKESSERTESSPSFTNSSAPSSSSVSKSVASSSSSSLG